MNPIKLYSWLARLLLMGIFVSITTVSGAAEDMVLVLPAQDGRVHSLSEYRGKWVIVNYWATTCPPCITEIPELQRFHDHHKDHDAVVIGVNYEDIRRDWLQDFMASVSMTYPVWQADPESGTPFGEVGMLPTTFVISPQGQLVARQVGPLTEAALDAYLARKQAAELSAEAGAPSRTGGARQGH